MRYKCGILTVHTEVPIQNYVFESVASTIDDLNLAYYGKEDAIKVFAFAIRVPSPRHIYHYSTRAFLSSCSPLGSSKQ